MNADHRPLSPHIGIYRWQVTSTLSILHRLTGIALSLGTVVLVIWLAAAASGPESYGRIAGLLGSPFGLLALVVWSWAFFYHLCNGIRHLAWDVGKGFELAQAYASGWAVVAASAALTAALWLVILGAG